MSETIDATPVELIRAVKEIGFEGIVAKRRDSLYESGKRTGAWVKQRINKGQEFVIGGYRLGLNPFDALIVGYYQDGKLYYAQKVRNRFVPRLRHDVAKQFNGLEINTCPFVNLPEKKRTAYGSSRNLLRKSNSSNGRPTVISDMQNLSRCGTIKTPGKLCVKSR